MHTLKWLRVIGNTIFAAGTVALAWFIFGLKGGWSINNKKSKLNI
jgi:nitric oxide reductase subunit B